MLEFMANESAIHGDDVSGTYRSKIATDREYMDAQSALYSNADGAKSAASQLDRGRRHMSGAELENQERRSADFGEVSAIDKYQASQLESFENPVDRSIEKSPRPDENPTSTNRSVVQMGP